MSKQIRLAAIVAAAGMGVPAFAQDSVSPGQGLANTDAVGAYNTAEVQNAFVVDLSPITSSAGNVFGIAPFVKASRTSPSFTTSQISAQALSVTKDQVTSFPAASYAFWNTAGPGINNGVNLAPQSVSPTGTSYQLGYAFAEFGTTESSRNNNMIVGGFINVRPQEPTRLYVTRTNAVINGVNAANDCSQFGIGAVDSSGNITFRADGNGVSAATCPGGIPANGQFILRTNLVARNTGVLNVVTGTGGSNATQTVLALGAEPVHSVPSTIPASIAGRPVYVGPNFNRQYVYENSALATIATMSHLTGGSDDQRGAIAYAPANYFGTGTLGTGGVLARDPGTGGTRAFAVWGMDGAAGSTGAPVNPRLLVVPATQTDHATGFNFTDTSGGFEGYRGPNAFRGGVSQLALGADRQGRLIAAAEYHILTTANGNPLNAISVARLPVPTAQNPSPQPEWGLAAYVGTGPMGIEGSPFYNADGERVGSLTTLNFVTGGSPTGPSISSPVIDAAGNIWFLAAFQNEVFNAKTGQFECRLNAFGQCSNSTGVFRAVYQPDLASGPGYRLELVMSNGAELLGANSDREYKVIFLSLASAQGVAASSSIFSGNGTRSTWAGADLAQLAQDDPRTLGGLILQASIIYDVNEDGQFVSLTGAQGNPASPDQNYNVMLFIGGAPFDDAEVCIADWNNDNAVNTADITAYLSAWFADRAAGTTTSDVTGDGAVTTADITAFLSLWFAARANPGTGGCP